MEKEPTLIEQKFEDAVKNFRKEMEKGKGKFSFCGEIERSVSGKQVLVQMLLIQRKTMKQLQKQKQLH